MLHLVVELVRDTPKRRDASVAEHARTLPQRPTPSSHPGRSLLSGAQPRAILRSDPRSGGQRAIAHGCKGGQRTAAQAAGSGCRPIHITSVRELARLLTLSQVMHRHGQSKSAVDTSLDVKAAEVIAVVRVSLPHFVVGSAHPHEA